MGPGGEGLLLPQWTEEGPCGAVKQAPWRHTAGKAQGWLLTPGLLCRGFTALDLELWRQPQELRMVSPPTRNKKLGGPVTCPRSASCQVEETASKLTLEPRLPAPWKHTGQSRQVLRGGSRWPPTPQETRGLTHHHALGTCYGAWHTAACRRYTESDPGAARF